MILVDTSVWIDHFRRGNRALALRLQEGAVFGHPFIVGELACGNLRQRNNILSLLSSLPQVPLADHREVLDFIDANRLMGSGLGWIDAHLLCSAKLANVGLWTLDTRLAKAARLVAVAAKP